MFLYILALIFGTILSVLILLKLYFYLDNGRCKDFDTDLTGKTILMTGGNNGIGREYVLDIAKRNATIIMGYRNLAKAEETKRLALERTGNDRIQIEQCDLSSMKSVQEFCSRILSKSIRIDCFVMFAAATGQSADNEKTEDGFEYSFQCNYLAHFLMLQMLFPTLNEQARVIVTSSSAHLIGRIDLDRIARYRSDRHPFLRYADSKLALVMLAKELTDRLSSKTTQITANSFNPGTVLTGSIESIASKPIRLFLTLIAFLYGKTLNDGAQTLIYLTVSKDLIGISGKYFSDCSQAYHNRSVNNKKLRKQFWDLSLELINPYFDKISI
ncbi:RUN and FYVE domain-containing protein 2 [Sarcoptes scabiei]|nr:RUN and FYVE domain-containing protein 2 [Sarcoptes scabiei]